MTVKGSEPKANDVNVARANKPQSALPNYLAVFISLIVSALSRHRTNFATDSSVYLDKEVYEESYIQMSLPITFRATQCDE